MPGLHMTDMHETRISPTYVVNVWMWNLLQIHSSLRTVFLKLGSAKACQGFRTVLLAVQNLYVGV